MKVVFFGLIFLSQIGSAAIFGVDDRIAISSFNPTHPVRELADATAVAVLSGLMTHDSEEVKIQIDTLDGYLCKEERFSKDRSLSYACTGFLVAPDLLVTAGHCVTNVGEVMNSSTGYCPVYSWLFGYYTNPSSDSESMAVGQEKLYRCKQIIYAIREERAPFRDYALIQLDRPVQGRRPLKLKEDTTILPPLKMVGYPLGTPAKLAHSAQVLLDHPNRGSFVSSLDAFAGNSGSPVLNAESEVIGILISGTPSHGLVQLPQRQCHVYNRCDEDGENCLEPDSDTSVFKEFQRVGSDVQRIGPILNLLNSIAASSPKSVSVP